MQRDTEQHRQGYIDGYRAAWMDAPLGMGNGGCREVHEGTKWNLIV